MVNSQRSTVNGWSSVFFLMEFLFSHGMHRMHGNLSLRDSLSPTDYTDFSDLYYLYILWILWSVWKFYFLCLGDSLVLGFA